MTRSNLIGGEMLNWSDLHPADARPAAAGPAATALVTATLQPDDTALIAGPHAAELITHAADTATSVDLIVRSAPDAEELAELLDDAKGQVFCGSLDRWSGDETYDVIVALDGLERLVGPDTATLPWAEALRRLTARLRPGGRLLLGAENAFGFQRLIQPDIAAALPRDEDWGRDIADRAPAGLKPLRVALGDAGLQVPQTYAVFPSLIQADVALASTEGFAAVVAARAVASRNEGPVLMDPYRLVLDAAEAGMAIELAPAWYFVIGAEVPAVLPEDVVPEGEGVLLEEHLFAALRSDDQAELRRAIPAYVAWLGTGGAGSPDNVILDGGTYRLFGEPQDLDVVEHLERFARRSLESGLRQPWPAAADPHQLTARLASMAGITVPEQKFRRSEVVRPQGSAEQLTTVARIADELAHASARAILFEGTVSGLRRSRTYQVGHRVLGPARAVRRRIKRARWKVKKAVRKVLR
ncbi:class I SAM-dependent methyltransferase [Kribbella sp. NPDC048928]|uniref:class I SAM-dependent methyltransferase n=1 Tax=Kribbella sp. NPDC048928 TaxID=3364111 RepID=UPI00371C5929